MVEIVTGVWEDADRVALSNVAESIRRAIDSSSYFAATFVAAEVANLAHRDFQEIPMVFRFTSWLYREWANPGMVAGAMRCFASGCVQRSLFILPAGDEERLVRLTDFIVEAEARRTFWITLLKMSAKASWRQIYAHAKVMWRRYRRREEMLTKLFHEQQLYDMDFNWGR